MLKSIHQNLHKIRKIKYETTRAPNTRTLTRSTYNYSLLESASPQQIQVLPMHTKIKKKILCITLILIENKMDISLQTKSLSLSQASKTIKKSTHMKYPVYRELLLHQVDGDLFLFVCYC